MRPDPNNPLAPDNVEIELRLLDLRPTWEIRQEIETACDAPETPENRHLISILQIELHDGELRDELELGRPVGCWCLGMGGREIVTLEDDGSFYRTTCTACPEGYIAKAHREQILAGRP